jgi:hypothetical protein
MTDRASTTKAGGGKQSLGSAAVRRHRTDIALMVALAEIAVPDWRHRETDTQSVEKLADSIKTIGLLNPITVRPLAAGRVSHNYELLAGLHRMEAYRSSDLNISPQRS